MHRTSRRLTLSIAVGVVLVAGICEIAGQAPPTTSQSPHAIIDPATLKWGPGPPALPAGVQVAVLEGNPEQTGLFTLRVKMPSGYAIPPHWHPTDEHVTVLSGTLMAGIGDKVEASSMHAMPAGGYAKMPARTNHYVRAKGATVIQVTGTGPFEVNYVNPNDDPRKKGSTSK